MLAQLPNRSIVPQPRLEAAMYSNVQPTKKMISIIIPTLNADALLADTLDSIANQIDPPDFEAIIVDGESTDDTIAVAQSYQTKIEYLRIISRPDNNCRDGMIDGLRCSHGEFQTFLMAGDTYFPNALRQIETFFATNPSANWVTGQKCVKRNGILEYKANPSFNRRMIRCGLYGTYLPFIQAEGTFWRASLSALINFKQLDQLFLATDYYIWFCFAKKHDLYVCDKPIGCFLIHEGQISSDKSGYRSELRNYSEKLQITDIPIFISTFCKSVLAHIKFNFRPLLCTEHYRKLTRMLCSK